MDASFGVSRCQRTTVQISGFSTLWATKILKRFNFLCNPSRGGELALVPRGEGGV